MTIKQCNYCKHGSAIIHTMNVRCTLKHKTMNYNAKCEEFKAKEEKEQTE